MGYPLDHSCDGPSWANPVCRQIYIYGHIHKGLSYISKAIVWTRAPAPGIAVKTVLLLVNAGEIDAGRELRFVPGREPRAGSADPAGLSPAIALRVSQQPAGEQW